MFFVLYGEGGALAVKDSTVPGCPSSFAVGLSGSWTRFSTACSETGTDVNGPTRSVNANNVGECGEFENTSIGRTRVYVRSYSPFMEYVKPSKPNVLDAAIVFFFSVRVLVNDVSPICPLDYGTRALKWTKINTRVAILSRRVR